MIKRLERLKNTVNKYMADLRPDRLTTYQSERKLVVSPTTRCTWKLVMATSYAIHTHIGMKNCIFFNFSQIYNLLYKLSNSQICYKETLVRSNHPMMILLCILYATLLPLFRKVLVDFHETLRERFAVMTDVWVCSALHLFAFRTLDLIIRR
jgi:hypothetical protein